jgi:glycosyltransferase involved in cell wall biosynthesis
MPPPPPAISILICAYNRADLVSAAIGSVLKQTRSDFELLIWDDGSTDDTADVARRAAGDDPRVRIVRAQHAGFTRSLAAASRQVSAPYLGWVDSDDAILPTCLAETSAVLDANPDVGMVYTDYLAMDQTGRVIGPGNRTKIPYSKERLLVDFLTFHFRLIRRSLFDAVGGVDESPEEAQDYDLCLKLSEVTRIEHLAKPLYLYRVHPNSISQGSRLRQIMSAKEVIARALKRRGMDREYDIDVEIVGRFKLKRKGPAA